jgi:hypothetical protein
MKKRRKSCARGFAPRHPIYFKTVDGRRSRVLTH